MADEKTDQKFNCMGKAEIPKLGFDAIKAMQSHASGGQGGPQDVVCPACTALVMLHAAAVAVVAADNTAADETINRVEFLRLAGSIFDAHKALGPEGLAKLRIIYARAVRGGMFERGLRASIEEAAAAQVSTLDTKETMN